MEFNKIVMPYKPFPLWKNVIHKELDRHMFAVIVAHRRFGKTIGMVNHLIKDALSNNKIAPMYAIVGPWMNQMKIAAWGPLKYYSHVVEGVKVNETDKYIEFPTKHVGAQGARIYVRGADNPDSARGAYWDGVVLDEYADMKPEMWSQIIRPAITNKGREGYCYFIGTPKGQNAFYERYKAAVEDPRWYTYKSDVESSGVLSQQQIADLRKDMSDVEFAQEYMCDFSVKAFNELFSLEELDAAFSRYISEKDVPWDMPVIQGVDIARYGDDRSVIWKRKGLLAYAKPRIYTGLDTMEIADRIADSMLENSADMTFIDAGNMGAGAIDRLKQMGYRALREIPFQSRAMDKQRYENIRAEMYFKLKEWIAAGGALPPEPGLREELAILQYKYSKHGRILLTSKDEIKEKLARSPDLADGLALTFAKKVPMRQRTLDGEGKKKIFMCNTNFSVMEAI